MYLFWVAPNFICTETLGTKANLRGGRRRVENMFSQGLMHKLIVKESGVSELPHVMTYSTSDTTMS